MYLVWVVGMWIYFQDQQPHKLCFAFVGETCIRFLTGLFYLHCCGRQLTHSNTIITSNSSSVYNSVGTLWANCETAFVILYLTYEARTEQYIHMVIFTFMYMQDGSYCNDFTSAYVTC